MVSQYSPQVMSAYRRRPLFDESPKIEERDDYDAAIGRRYFD